MNERIFADPSCAGMVERSGITTDETVGDPVESFFAQVDSELRKAQREHGCMTGCHDGYARILEEVDELWDEVRKRERDYETMHAELVQIAAMCVRMSIEVCLPRWIAEDQGLEKPAPYIPAVIATCLQAAKSLAEEGDWQTLQSAAEMLAQEARVRALDARADEAGVVGTMSSLHEQGYVRQVSRPDGEVGYELTPEGREFLTKR